MQSGKIVVEHLGVDEDNEYDVFASFVDRQVAAGAERATVLRATKIDVTIALAIAGSVNVVMLLLAASGVAQLVVEQKKALGIPA